MGPIRFPFQQRAVDTESSGEARGLAPQPAPRSGGAAFIIFIVSQLNVLTFPDLPL